MEFSHPNGSAGEWAPTVLMVGDEPAIREVAATLLEEEGYAVCRAADGREALLAVEEHAVDLVVSDVRMPKLDGAALVRELRRQGSVVPVVLRSAVYADVALPGVRFVPKPFELDHLLTVVEKALTAPW